VEANVWTCIDFDEGCFGLLLGLGVFLELTESTIGKTGEELDSVHDSKVDVGHEGLDGHSALNLFTNGQVPVHVVISELVPDSQELEWCVLEVGTCHYQQDACVDILAHEDHSHDVHDHLIVQVQSDAIDESTGNTSQNEVDDNNRD
jgi:hypothetical protein